MTITNPNELSFATPPGPNSRGATAARRAVVDVLKQHPGKWAVVQSGLSNPNHGTWRRFGVDVRAEVVVGKYVMWASWPVDEPKAEPADSDIFG